MKRLGLGFEMTVNLHLNERTKNATYHRIDCSFGHTRDDSRGKWHTRVKESAADKISDDKGYKRHYCGYCKVR